MSKYSALVTIHGGKIDATLIESGQPEGVLLAMAKNYGTVDFDSYEAPLGFQEGHLWPSWYAEESQKLNTRELISKMWDTASASFLEHFSIVGGLLSR